ncbi:hypothetical protein F25303_10415 [Fusarium sp. NRRL 25303]|nr:hypothetical protein F25303_10415 [Fusarium sp. NRRL 25303]
MAPIFSTPDPRNKHHQDFSEPSQTALQAALISTLGFASKLATVHNRLAAGKSSLLDGCAPKICNLFRKFEDSSWCIWVSYIYIFNAVSEKPLCYPVGVVVAGSWGYALYALRMTVTITRTPPQPSVAIITLFQVQLHL